MMFLHRVSIRPRHLDDWLATWPQQLHDLQRHGFTHHQAYLQEHAEPKLTWLYSHPDASPAFPAPVAEAMIVALGDDAHVQVQKERYRARRDRLKPALERAGFRIDHSEAGLYLWATEGRDAWESMQRLAELGILAGPGVFYGDAFPQHVRFSLTATDERIEQAALRLEASAVN